MTTNYNANISYNSAINYDGGASIVSPAILPTLGFMVQSKAGAISPLPELSVESVSFEDSAPSAISFTLPMATVGASLVDHLSIVSMTINGTDIQDGRWLIRNKGWNSNVKNGTKTFTGKHLLWDRLEHTTIQPGAAHKYDLKSPGFILNELFNEAKARNVGYWSNFTWTFTSAIDSAGNAWPTVIRIEYLTNAKYSDIVTNLVDRGLIDVHLVGDEIQVLVSNTSGRNTTALLVVGKDLSDAPQQASTENILSDVTVLGDDGIAITRSNPATRTAYWREEGGISQGGTKDVGTLSLFGDVALSGGAEPRVQRTYGLVISHERPHLVLRDFWVGDWVSTQQDDEQAQSYRVKQITLKQEDKKWSGSLVLNDKFIENELRLAKKVDGIIGGATITGSSQTSTPDNLKDTGIPSPPTGVMVTSAVYQDGFGVTKSIATASWNAVTTNTDGSPATDLDVYYVAWWYSDQPYDSKTVIRVQSDETSAAWSNLDPGRTINVFVWARDRDGNDGPWNGAAIPLVLAEDTIPPPQPSGPLLSSILRTYIIEFTGLAATGDTMPPDFDFVEIYSSVVNNFDPLLEGDYHGRLHGAGQFYLSAYGHLPGATVYFKFIAVDKSGNRSVPSSQNWRSLQGVQSSDILAGAIIADKIAAGAITTQHLSAGAITAEKISVGQTANLVVDPSFNDSAWRARRLTTAWSENPARWAFKDWSGISRNGYYLQALSTPDGVNGGRMYICDWLPTMLGESYYAAIYMRNGEFAPNAEATMRLGVEVTLADGSIQSDGVTFAPFSTWTKYGFRFLIQNPDWVKVRFFVRADSLTAGDIAMDDWEVRSGVGTTSYAQSRGLLDALGLFAWDDAEEMTFSLDFRTGDFTAKGSIQSGFTGKRTVINPGTTFLPEIRFYPVSGETFAYINATDNGSIPFIGVNAPDVPGVPTQALVLFDNGFQLGDVDKALGSMVGPGIVGGTGNAGNLWIQGKLPGAASDGRQMLYGGSYVVASGTSGVTISKLYTAVSGAFYPLISVHRNVTAGFNYHISANSSASYSVWWTTNASFQTILHEIQIRA